MVAPSVPHRSGDRRPSGCPAFHLARPLACSAVLSTAVFTTPVLAQSAAPLPASPPIAIHARWDTARARGSREVLELRLDRAPAEDAGRVALVVGGIDVSGVLQHDGERIVYDPSRTPLQAGASDVVAYLVDGTGQWIELGRFPARVRTRVGLDESRVQPGVELSSTGPLVRRETPGEPAGGTMRHDVSLRLGLEGRFARDGWNVTSTSNAVGVTNRTQRLRYGDLDHHAPALDLADYRVHVTRSGLDASLGHQTVGQHRLLMNGFTSRGVGGTVRVAPGVAFDASLLNGTSMVGWSNPFGFASPDHRVASAGVSFELVPARPGALHVHLTGADGSLLPRTGFNQGAVTDAEQSRSAGVRVAISDAGQRVRFEGGVARSRFSNPADPLLAAGESIVAVETEHRNARYAELHVDLLRRVPFPLVTGIDLTASARHERIDPMYRVVGAFVQSDRDAHGVDVAGAIGALVFKAGLGALRDNLQRIPSILTTHTDGSTLSASMPLASLVRGGAWFLPSTTYMRERVHQSGDGVPADGGFEPSHVPDQVSVNEQMGLTWSVLGRSIAYNRNVSRQDNRQIGRELADFRTTVDALSLGGSLGAALDLTLDVSRERQHSAELDASQRLDRVGTSARWRPLSRTDVLVIVSRAHGVRLPDAERHADRTRDLELQLELSRGFDVYRRFDGATQGRFVFRFARTRATVLPGSPQQLLDVRSTWTLHAGASFRVY